MKTYLYLLGLCSCLIIFSCQPQPQEETISGNQVNIASQSKVAEPESRIDSLERPVNNLVQEVKIDFSKHNEFDQFWLDFKEAVLAENSEEVAKMVNYPFTDLYKEVYAPEEKLEAGDEASFINRFERLFTKDVKEAINKDLLRVHEEGYEVVEGEDIIYNDQRILEVPNNDLYPHLVFDKIDGLFKLDYIAYYP